MDTPNQKQGRKMMEENTLGMTITDDGYRHIAAMLIGNVVENVQTNEDWSRKDASFLIMGAMMIGRHLSDDEFILLTEAVEGRYSGK